MAILKDLLVTGAARFKGKIYGDLEGHAKSAGELTGNIETSQVNGLTNHIADFNTWKDDSALTLEELEERVRLNEGSIDTLELASDTHATKIELENSVATLTATTNTLDGKINGVSATVASQGTTIQEIQGNLGDHITNATKEISDIVGRIQPIEESIETFALASNLEQEIANRIEADDNINKSIGDLRNGVQLTYATKEELNQSVINLQNKDKEISDNLTNHAAVVGNANDRGHVNLSDSVSDNYSTTDGFAATPLAVSTVANQVKSHAAYAETMYIYTGDEVLLDSSIPINADTVGGMTVDQILAEARGEGTATGTVGYSSATPSNPTSVTLTNVTSGDHLYPKTNTASITDFSTATSSFLKFAKGTTEPTKAVGTIWFYGSSAPYQIRIYNGSAWEVVNSWQ